MRAYSCYFLNKGGMIAAVETIECADDGDARHTAVERLRSTHHHAVEVTDQARLVLHQARDPAWTDTPSRE